MASNKLWDRRSALRSGLASAAAASGLGVALRALGQDRATPQTTGRVRTPTGLAGGRDVSLIDIGPDDVCTLTCEQTLGPCYYDQTTVRRDITENTAGLPMLLGFLVVDADTCEPIENATVDIWHASADGLYSAPIAAMCNGNDPVARASTFLRGVQPTGVDGWAHFNSVYPGWYSGRTTHIHGTVRLSETELVTTQWYFPDDLSSFVYTNHAAYVPRGDKDTPNTGDNILGGSLTRMAPYTFSSRLILEQSIVSLKVVAVRRAGSTCNA